MEDYCISQPVFWGLLVQKVCVSRSPIAGHCGIGTAPAVQALGSLRATPQGPPHPTAADVGCMLCRLPGEFQTTEIIMNLLELNKKNLPKTTEKGN